MFWLIKASNDIKPQNWHLVALRLFLSDMQHYIKGYVLIWN